MKILHAQNSYCPNAFPDSSKRSFIFPVHIQKIKNKKIYMYACPGPSAAKPRLCGPCPCTQLYLYLIFIFILFLILFLALPIAIAIALACPLLTVCLRFAYRLLTVCLPFACTLPFPHRAKAQSPPRAPPPLNHCAENLYHRRCAPGEDTKRAALIAGAINSAPLRAASLPTFLAEQESGSPKAKPRCP